MECPQYLIKHFDLGGFNYRGKPQFYIGEALIPWIKQVHEQLVKIDPNYYAFQAKTEWHWVEYHVQPNPKSNLTAEQLKRFNNIQTSEFIKDALKCA